MRVYHSATVIFLAPSDLSGIGGMSREMIRSTPLWSKGELSAPRRDCVLVQTSEQRGMRHLRVARILLFFSFHFEGTMFPCALVHWFETVEDASDSLTGMWIVQQAYNPQGTRAVSVIHIDRILRGTHLLPIFGEDFIPHDLHYTQSLDAFKSFYVNKFIDHHSHEVLFDHHSPS